MIKAQHSHNVNFFKETKESITFDLHEIIQKIEKQVKQSVPSNENKDLIVLLVISRAYGNIMKVLTSVLKICKKFVEVSEVDELSAEVEEILLRKIKLLFLTQLDIPLIMNIKKFIATVTVLNRVLIDNFKLAPEQKQLVSDFKNG